MPLTKCWASPAAVSALVVAPGSAVFRYPVTSGAAGLVKSGPTAQPAVTRIVTTATTKPPACEPRGGSGLLAILVFLPASAFCSNVLVRRLMVPTPEPCGIEWPDDLRPRGALGDSIAMAADAGFPRLRHHGLKFGS